MPYLYVAMFGAVMIAVGIACQLIQLYVSVRDRNKPENMCEPVSYTHLTLPTTPYV